MMDKPEEINSENLNPKEQSPQSADESPAGKQPPAPEEAAPPAPPADSMPQAPQAVVPPPPAEPPHGSPATPAPDPMRMEKIIYLVANVLIGMLTSYLAANDPQMMESFAQMKEAGIDFDVESMIMPFMVGMLIFGTIVTAVALFLQMVWLKWTCLACTGCTGLQNIIGIFGSVVIAMQESNFNGFIAQLVAVVMAAWLIAILWRDVQNINAHQKEQSA